VAQNSQDEQSSNTEGGRQTAAKFLTENRSNPVVHIHRKNQRCGVKPMPYEAQASSSLISSSSAVIALAVTDQSQNASTLCLKKNWTPITF